VERIVTLDGADSELVGYVYPRECHPDLDLVCGHCRSYPLNWASRYWNCKTRGLPVCADTHACSEYREDAARVPKPSSFGARFRELPAAINPRRLRRKARLPEPPQDLRTLHGGVVYFIDCQEFTKIGFTANPINHRFQGLQASNPHRLHLWGLVRGTVEVEGRFHAAAMDGHHHYEWFKLNRAMRKTLQEIIVREGGELYPHRT